jgi:glycosyltransferase involved in cell wall biosynthesis
MASLIQANIMAGLAMTFARQQTRLVLRVENHMTAMSRESQHTRLMHIAYRAIGSVFPKANHIIAISSGIKTDLVEQFHLSPEKISVIFNPVLSPAAESVPAPHPWLKDKTIPVAVSTGRLHEVKQHHITIEAIKRLQDTAPVRLLILGDGPERDALESLIERRGLADRVCLVGFADNPSEYYAHADLFILASKHEGFGIVLVDALAAGLPVISTDCPSSPAEILHDGKYGHLVPVGDPAALAAAIQNVLQGGRRPAPPAEWMAQFDLKNVLGQYADLLEGTGRRND